MIHPDITIVDKNNQVIGAATMEDAQKKGLYHRIVRIFVFNNKKQLFLQQRSYNMANFPGLWDQSVGGHVDAGEDNITAALREAEEEIGLVHADLSEVGVYYSESVNDNRNFKRFNILYTTTTDQQLKLDPEEVESGKWVSLAELDTLIANNPHEFTEGLITALEFYRKNLPNT